MGEMLSGPRGGAPWGTDGARSPERGSGHSSLPQPSVELLTHACHTYPPNTCSGPGPVLGTPGEQTTDTTSALEEPGLVALEQGWDGERPGVAEPEEALM